MTRFEKLVQILVPIVVGALLIFLVSPFVEGMAQLLAIATGIMIGLAGIARQAESKVNVTEPEPWQAQATEKAKSSFAHFQELFEHNAGETSVRIRRDGLPVLDDGAWTEVCAVLPSREIVVKIGKPNSETSQSIPFDHIIDWRVVLPDGSVRGAFSRYAELQHQRWNNGGILPKALQQERALLVDCHLPIGDGVVPCDRPKEWEEVISNWKAFARSVEAVGGEVYDFSVSAPAQESEIVDAEEALGIKIPSALRRVLSDFSADVHYSWILPDSFSDEFGSPIAAESATMQWSLREVLRFDKENSDWFSECCPDMLAVLQVPNGDIIAINHAEDGRQPVVYWSHDGWDLSGFEIAPDFASYLILTSKIGAVGPEHWYWMPFVEGDPLRLCANGEAASAFRRALDVQLG